MFWPGSGIKKSEGNAFDWQGAGSEMLKDKELKRTEIGKQSMRKTSLERKVSGLTLQPKGKK